MRNDFMADGSLTPDGHEICAGCGAVAPKDQTVVDEQVVTKPGRYPWVGIGAPDLAVQTTADHLPGPNAEEMVARPVCDACHKDPAHRTVSALKVHFHPREGYAVNVLAARAQTMRDL